MDRDGVFEKLNSIFRDIFDDESIVVTESTWSGDIAGWDSLMHVTLMTEIQDEFDVKFDMKKNASMKRVGEMADEIIRLKE